MEGLMNIKGLTLIIYILTLLMKNLLPPTKDKVYIYESPDNGETIYRRVFGNYSFKELIQSNNDKG